MPIEVQYLGILKEVTGTEAENFERSGTKTEILEVIAEKYPELANLYFITAINGVITHKDPGIREGDRIALIPPAPGG